MKMDHAREVSLGELLQISSSYWKSSTVHCGVKLDIFTHLGSNKLSAKGVAEKIGANVRGVETLLNALVSMHLLEKEEDKYRNTLFSSQYLVKGEPKYSGYIIMHHFHLVDAWAQLDKSVMSGSPVAKRSYGEDVERESFLMGMFNIAVSNAVTIAKQVNLSGRRHLLDLGGGPGTYSIFFCLENPDLKATIFDLPTTKGYAENTINQYDMTDRISFKAGNFTSDSLGEGYDVAWLSQVLHSNGPEACQNIITKTVSALEPGGLIMVHEFFLDDTKTGPLFPALFSLNMLVNNGEGRSYSGGEITEMLRNAGVSDIERLPFQGPNDSYVLCGKV